MIKKSFTLFEILISIILVSIVYTFAINSLSNSVNNRVDTITLDNLKEKLLEFDFQKTITVKCIEDDLSCFIFLDDQKVPIEKKIEHLFINKPTIYEYTKTLDRLEFSDIELENLEMHEVVFEYKCNKNRKCSELVIENENEVLLFNDIHKKPIKLKYISDIEDIFQKNIQEVKDAF